MEVTNENKSFAVYLISLLCSLYTIEGKVYVRQWFTVMQVIQWILTKVMHWISIKVIQKLVN